MPRTDRTERLLNLVIALMAASAPLPRARIREGVTGYGDASSDAAFERMFERDKDEVRSMGIPVETVVDVNGEVSGYRIDRGEYRFEAAQWTLAERTALALAARTWAGAIDDAGTAVAAAKIESVAGMAASPVPPATITASDAALLPLMRAVRAATTVSFGYLRPDAEVPAARTVSPWALGLTHGRWQMSGYDHERESLRTFRISRIVGTVTTATEPFVEAPEGFSPRDPGALEPAVEATVLVRPGQAALLRRHALSIDPEGTHDRVVVAFSSESELVSAALGAGASAIVLEPPHVRARVTERLAVLAQAQP